MLKYIKQIWARPRCVNCYKINDGTNKRSCCSTPRQMTWDELVELQKTTLHKLTIAEKALAKKTLTPDEAKGVLTEIAFFKQPELF